MSTTPNYANTPNYASGILATGVTTLTVTGVTGLILVSTAAANGTRISRVRFKAVGTTTAGTICLWIYTGSGNAALFDQSLTQGVTPSSSVLSEQHDLTYTDLVLPSGTFLYASAFNTEAWNVETFGGNL